MPEKKPVERDGSGGVQTVETVLNVLNAFIGAEPTPMLKSIGERAGMHPAKVHRYLVSFSKHGYVRQDTASGRYRFGPSTLLLGYAALNAIPVVPIARPVLKQLVELNSCSAFIALWSDAGPRIVLQEKESAPIAVVAHVGSIFPLLRSATGRTFAAWLPRAVTAELLRRELLGLAKNPVPDCPATLKEAETVFKDIRHRGMARATGLLNAAVHGLSAPIFDRKGSICAVFTMLGQAGQFDTRWSGAIAKSLAAAASGITAALAENQAATVERSTAQPHSPRRARPV